jgi:hypothetical protein
MRRADGFPSGTLRHFFAGAQSENIFARDGDESATQAE